MKQQYSVRAGKVGEDVWFAPLRGIRREEMGEKSGIEEKGDSHDRQLQQSRAKGAASSFPQPVAPKVGIVPSRALSSDEGGHVVDVDFKTVCLNISSSTIFNLIALRKKSC
ncbi:hypothetical protein DV515_00000514 [Chloebia gouldiae]|uniref:Uncharacterized protein n=1 Tax=Chloebia gouldiae TaxID=44316 RepID=A0A3L8T1T9_CHLGU|nr:hypothetical protein DV515_00000514 [Chloebia gouldiae]